MRQRSRHLTSIELLLQLRGRVALVLSSFTALIERDRRILLRDSAESEDLGAELDSATARVFRCPWLLGCSHTHTQSNQRIA